MEEESLNLTDDFEDMVDEIIDDTKWRGIRLSAADAAGIVVSAVRPMLKDMAYDERRNACADLAKNLRNAGMVSDIRISIGSSGRQEEEDPRELGWRIMRKRNPHYRGKEDSSLRSE